MVRTGTATAAATTATEIRTARALMNTSLIYKLLVRFWVSVTALYLSNGAYGNTYGGIGNKYFQCDLT